MSFDLTVTEDQTQIRDAALTMLAEHFPLERFDSSATDDLAPLADFGAFALALPEEAGGAGFSIVEEALLHVEFGRHLLPPGCIAAAVAARILLANGQADRAESVVTGGQPVAAAIRSGDSALVSGGGDTLAILRDGTTLSLTDLPDGGEAIPAMGGIGTLRRLPLADLSGSNILADAPTTQLWQLLTSAQLLGIAAAARDLAVDYAQTREQFGRPIGSFQALKHQAADMAIRTEQLSALLDMAAIALRDGRADAAFQVSALARLAPRAALANARAAIQIHGGMGFSAETRPHLYLKGAHMMSQLLAEDDMLAHAAPLAPYPEDPT